MRLSLPLLICALAAGCGDGGEAGTPRVSAVLLNDHPPVATSGDFGSYVWAASHEGPTVKFHPSSQSITASGERVMTVASLLDGGTNYLLVSSIDSAGVLALDRFHDANNDGIPDQSTKTTLLTSGTTPRYVTSIYPRSRSEMYLLDARQGDIIVAWGANGAWVSTTLSTPFAAYANYPALKHIRRILDGTTAGVFGVFASPAEKGSMTSVSELPSLHFPDANSDHVADSMTAESTDRRPVLDLPTPFAGQTQVTARRVGAVSTMTVEIWSVDPDTKVDVSLLGSVSMDATEGTKSVPLSSALTSGMWIAARYQGSSALLRTLYPVTAAWPQIVGGSPAVISPNTSTSITLTGVNFTQNMTLKVMRFGSDAQSVSFTFNSSTSVSATLPAFPNLSLVSVYALGDGQSDSDALGSARFCVNGN